MVYISKMKCFKSFNEKFSRQKWSINQIKDVIFSFFLSFGKSWRLDKIDFKKNFYVNKTVSGMSSSTYVVFSTCIFTWGNRFLKVNLFRIFICCEKYKFKIHHFFMKSVKMAWKIHNFYFWYKHFDFNVIQQILNIFSLMLYKHSQLQKIDHPSYRYI